MTKFKNVFAIAAFAMMVFGISTVASAQYYPNGGYPNGGYPNGGYGGYPNGNNGGYGNGGYYGGDLRGVAQSLKNKSAQFERETDRNSSNRGGYGNYGGYNNNANLEEVADRFNDAVVRFEKAYCRGRNMNNSVDEAQEMIQIGQQINQFMYNGSGNYLAQQWYSISNDLQIVANAYGIQYYNNGNYNRGNRNRNNRNNYPNNYPNNGGWGNGRQAPSWWPF